MIGNRTRGLLGLAALAGALLLVRLHQVQIVEHEIWAREAARLVHSGRALPYRRGSIRDRDGRVLSRDKNTYSLALHYREFRRGHPLGQVTHALSLLEGRAVELQEARENLPQWSLDLVRLRPKDLDAFARGEAFMLGERTIPALERPGSDRHASRTPRARRAADVRYYLRRLLGLGAPAWKRVQKRARRDEVGRSYLELAAAERSSSGSPFGPDEIAREIEHRLAEAMGHFARLADRLDQEDPGGEAASPDGRSSGSSSDLLIEELERARRWVEDATASKLFAEAAGFAPGRLEAETLESLIDFGWIRDLLAWDEPRLAEWIAETRQAWRANWLEGYALPRLVASLRADPAVEVGPDDVLDLAAAIFAGSAAVEAALDGAPRAWRELDEVAVLDDFDGLFAGAAPRAALYRSREALPFIDPEVRGFRPPEAERWNLIDRCRHPLPERPSWGSLLSRHLSRASRRDTDSVIALIGHLVDDWEEVFQESARECLRAAREEAAGAGELSADGRLVIAAGLRERAVERADFFLKDYGMRPRALQRREPEYAVVFLLTRYPEWYPGFVARETRQRVYEVLDDGARPASELVGWVSAFDVFAMQRQRPAQKRLRSLASSPRRTSDEEVELTELVGSVVLHDEKRGVYGVEGFWNEELSGQNGFAESWGLEDAMGASGRERGSVRAPVDGEDVWLTLDLDLQRAAERTLREPERVDDPDFDHAWYAEPVGAIVLVTPEGDVLAAASEPNPGSSVSPDAQGQRALRLERTLRQPTFQPPGSVFKPFVAAWALEAIGLDPEWTVDCAEIERGGAGYVDVRCHSRYGHGVVNLEQALVRSCNAYFAALGEKLPASGFVELADTFGFGEPCGVRSAPPWSFFAGRRTGLHEDVPGLGFGRGGWGPFQHRLAGNGLGVVEATPMQVVRAVAGLATGALPALRLVERVGDRAVPRAPDERLAIRPENLERIRSAMIGVAADPLGTAHAALGPEVLGLDIAVKTGSADLTGRRDEDGDLQVRKHTWVAGWVPRRDPVAVFVVFVHDTATTSSHGAVYLARQFLTQPEVLAWLETRGVAHAVGEGGSR